VCTSTDVLAAPGPAIKDDSGKSIRMKILRRGARGRGTIGTAQKNSPGYNRGFRRRQLEKSCNGWNALHQKVVQDRRNPASLITVVTVRGGNRYEQSM